ncbi:hypothetical protein LEP1GSC108_4889 [Leptospira weilii str. UI 13098]|uniref:Uncharacterized protein n=1 Tax=Leptospira weilii str. UI 13098 TaxID=1088542 RepID=M6Q4I2_9LEPT|nr:hypothetical protein LEP1GSC086_4541 [Leptospira weilii str. LNT 1234]EMN90209.1 hypothetical protein LEP1GSC108_4889 [Leptospira weilii str. UI 13098]
MKQGIKLTPLKKPFATDLYKIEYRYFYFSAVTLRYWKSFLELIPIQIVNR